MLPPPYLLTAMQKTVSLGDLTNPFFPLSAFVNGGNDRRLSDLKNPPIAKIM
jgi:hypothetical protein